MDGQTSEQQIGDITVRRQPRSSGKRPNPVFHYVFTVNNYTDEQQRKIREFANKFCKYLIFGREKGEKGTPHLQGFFSLRERKRITAVHKDLDFTELHLEESRGSPSQNREYCSKEGDFEEFGTLPKTGSETRQENYRDAIASARKGDLASIEEKHPRLFLQYLNTFEKIALSCTPQQATPGTTGLWIHGESGCGKSRAAHALKPYIKNANKWWCGYRDQPIALVEDLDKSHQYLLHHLKIWGDHYPFNGETKGSSRNIRPALVIVTSNHSARDIFGVEGLGGRDLDAIERRYEHVYFDGCETRHLDESGLVRYLLDQIRDTYKKGVIEQSLISSSSAPAETGTIQECFSSEENVSTNPLSVVAGPSAEEPPLEDVLSVLGDLSAEDIVEFPLESDSQEEPLTQEEITRLLSDAI